jgi:hypothetical protein
MEGSCQTAGDTGEADQHIKEAHIGKPRRFYRPAGQQYASQNERHSEVEQASALRNLILSSGLSSGQADRASLLAPSHHEIELLPDAYTPQGRSLHVAETHNDAQDPQSETDPGDDFCCLGFAISWIARSQGLLGLTGLHDCMGFQDDSADDESHNGTD